MCGIGNGLADLSNNAGDLSTKATVGGLVVTGAGAVTAQPEVVGVGVGLMRLGGSLGWISAGSQIASGLAQGISGHGYSNLTTGLVGAAFSYGIGQALSPVIPSGYRTVSQRAGDAQATGLGLIGGSIFGTLGANVPGMGAGTVSCN